MKHGKNLWKTEYDTLANYNSEVSRGIVHTSEWKEKMKQLQNTYDEDFIMKEAIKNYTGQIMEGR